MSEANPDRERWSQDHAAPTAAASQDPAPTSGPAVPADPDPTVVRRPRSTKPRTGAPRAPRPAGTAPRKVTPTPVPSPSDPGTPTPTNEDTRVTSRSTFSAGLDHLPKAGSENHAPAPFATPQAGTSDADSAPVWPTPSSDSTPAPSVLERARAGVAAAAAVAMEKVAQVSAPVLAPPVTAPPAVNTALAVELAPTAVKRPRRTRRARLRISRIDPWSVMKTSLLFGIAGGIIFVVAVYVLMSVIEATGLFTAINQMVKDILASPTDTTTFDITAYINTKRATGLAALIGAIDVVIFTALATVFSFLYNLSATMLGGLEITLAED